MGKTDRVCVCVVIWSLLLLLYFFARRPRGVEEQQMRVNGVSLLDRREKGAGHLENRKCGATESYLLTAS